MKRDRGFISKKSFEEMAAIELDNFVTARLERIDSKGIKYHGYTKKMLSAAKNSLDLVREGQQLDTEIAEWISDSLSCILANKVSEIESVRTGGAPKDSDSIRNAKRTAAIYRQAVTAKDVQDVHPVKTLSDYYGCSHQTIRDWCKNAPRRSWVEFRRDLPLDGRIKQLMRKLKYDSELIRQCSKTQGAVRARKSPKSK